MYTYLKPKWNVFNITQCLFQRTGLECLDFKSALSSEHNMKSITTKCSDGFLQRTALHVFSCLVSRESADLVSPSDRQESRCVQPRPQ